MQGFDDFPGRATRWRRVARESGAGERKDVAGLIGQELRLVFSVAKVPPDLAGVDRLLERIEARRKRRR